MGRSALIDLLLMFSAGILSSPVGSGHLLCAARKIPIKYKVDIASSQMVSSNTYKVDCIVLYCPTDTVTGQWTLHSSAQPSMIIASGDLVSRVDTSTCNLVFNAAFAWILMSPLSSKSAQSIDQSIKKMYSTH